DLRERPRRDLLLAVDLAGERIDLALRGGGAGPDAFVEPLVALALAFGRSEARPQRRQRVLEARLAGLLHRQEFGELRDLRVEPRQRRVLSGHLLRQEELHDDEYRQQED